VVVSRAIVWLRWWGLGEGRSMNAIFSLHTHRLFIQQFSSGPPRHFRLTSCFRCLLAVIMIATSRHNTQLHFCKLYWKTGYVGVKVMTSLLLNQRRHLARDCCDSLTVSLLFFHAIPSFELHFTDSKWRQYHCVQYVTCCGQMADTVHSDGHNVAATFHSCVQRKSEVCCRQCEFLRML